MAVFKRIWFKRKAYGYGWTPATWQGWLVLAVWLGIFVMLIKNPAHPHVLASIGSAVVLIAVCWATGEAPRWQWGSTERRCKEARKDR